ncbi:hypothetical protein [Brevundimonas sp.]|uniref:hypothetical protein n=1 Tax=Brevundimonas sp. TaxID=1871086 RepID=UPI001DFB70AE|nr:hypothetical protein [Brevundimonas sp.]MBL0947395.1 hypothetical protein [Brevundimonas sp.]
MMFRRIALVACGVAALALAACDPPLEPANAPAGSDTGATANLPEGFSNDLKDDVSGFYMPTTEVRQGSWRLDHVFMGQSQDFAAWEGGTREGRFAPVMLEFVDESSPMIQTELGEIHTGRVRVLPRFYSVENGMLRFVGVSEELGIVQLDARLNDEALATARRNLGAEGAVLNGTLSLGDAPPQAVGFRWWAGD